jgi:phosphoribosyl 1,2-cyclic phosphate phosphodiesterase
MKITLLGTGTSHGVPMIGCNCDVCTSGDPRDKRLRTSIFIEVQGVNLLIDTTPDFRQQALRARLNRIDAVLFTHAHKDHLAGLDDIKPFNYQSREPIPIFAEQRVLDAINTEFEYAFRVKDNSVPKLELHPIIPENEFIFKNIKIIPIRMMHDQLPVLGFRIGNFAYLTDMKTMDNSELEKVVGVDTLIIEALRIHPHPSHLSLDEALQLVDKIQPRVALLTHISHKLGKHVDIKTMTPKNVCAGYDNEVVYVSEV